MGGLLRLADRYEVHQRLGGGGMAEVYLGTDTRLGRPVAVKLLRPGLADDPTHRARFGREARAAAGLNHPGIVTVHDNGEVVIDDRVQPYLVMEHIDGVPLSQLLSGGPLPAAQALDIVVEILDALDHAHRGGVVHRDIKPGNVMVTAGRRLKVTDFGIATTLTDTGLVSDTLTVLGTANYMSPEQAAGRGVDARSDLYATGCLLYELLTGAPPFTGESAYVVIDRHVRTPPEPPSARAPHLPPVVDRLVLTALAKDPQQRYGSAAAMRQAAVEARSQLPDAPAGATLVDHAPSGGQAPVGRASLPTLSLPPETGAGALAGGGTLPGATPVPPPTGPRRARRAVTITATALVAVLVVAAAAYFGARIAGVDTRPAQVPNVEGLTLPEATDRLRDAGLTVGEVHHSTDDDVEAGRVISTDPPADRLAVRGSSVEIYVSEGPAELVVVPAGLVGRTRADATGLLEKAGFEVETEYRPSKRPRDEVIGVDPEPGAKLEKGDTVTLVLSCDRDDECEDDD